MNEDGKFVAAFRFAILAEYLLEAGIDVKELQDGIQIIAEEME